MNAATSPRSAPAGGRDRGRVWGWVALALVLALTAAARWRVLDAPLERDEGEYAYMAQLMLQGVPPYAEAYNMKLPGIYAAYAGILALFGQTARGIHQGLLLVNAASIVLLFLLARRLFGPVVGVAAAAGFAVLSLSIAVQGVFANAEHFILPFALGGLLCTQGGLEEGRGGRLALGGLLLGCGFVVKQHGLFFAAAGGLSLLAHFARERPLRPALALRRGLLFGAAALVPYGLTCLVLWLAGVFPAFWLWTFRYARAYSSRIGFSDNSVELWKISGLIYATAPALCVLAGTGLASLAWDAGTRRRWPFLLPFTVLSVLSIFPGYFFRAHYFQLALPALALLFGLGACALGRLLGRLGGPSLGALAAALLAAGAVAQSVQRQYEPLVERDGEWVSWMAFGPPFQISQAIAERLRADTAPTDRIAILGSEPQIYFYAGRRAATGYLYTYPLMEPQPYAPRMLAEFERQIESHAPRYLVWVDYFWSWLPTEEPYMQLRGWFERYRRDYELVARYDLGSRRLRVIDGPELGVLPAPKESIELYRRVTR